MSREQLQPIRDQATRALASLKQEAQDHTGPFRCWVTDQEYTKADADGAGAFAKAAIHSASDSPLTGLDLSAMKRFFDTMGFLRIPKFATAAECVDMLGEMHSLIDDWEPGSELAQFRTDSKQSQAQGANKYFFESSDKVHFFSEPGAIDLDTGHLRTGLAKHDALNKVLLLDEFVQCLMFV